jgi:hypothetical protein
MEIFKSHQNIFDSVYRENLLIEDQFKSFDTSYKDYKYRFFNKNYYHGLIDYNKYKKFEK